MATSNEIEFGLYVSGDGIRSSVPWRLKRYGSEGALTDESIRGLIEAFALSEVQLRALSKALGTSLDPNKTPTLAVVQRSKAAARAKKLIAQACADLSSAHASILAAQTRLSKVSTKSARDRDAAKMLDTAFPALADLEKNIGSLHRAMAVVALSTEAALVIEPTDKRYARDERRVFVLRDLFRFWYEAGRKLTFTTDPTTSERRGPLIDFVNAVVACVTEPSSHLSEHTIVEELREAKPGIPVYFELVKLISDDMAAKRSSLKI